MKNELMVVKQLPIIEQRLKNLAEEIDSKVKPAIALVCTEENYKSVKTLRAQLNKESAEYESQRKTIKSAVLKPYNEFEQIYKDCVSDKYREAEAALKNKINEVEGELKQRKQEEVETYFNEYAQSLHIDFVAFQRSNIRVGLSDNLKSLKEQSKVFVDRISSDLQLIETQEYNTEILVEYKKDLNVSRAITEVSNRHKAIEKEKEKAEQIAPVIKREEESKADVVAKIEALAPVEEEITVAFTVTATKSKVIALREYMKERGIKYE